MDLEKLSAEAESPDLLNKVDKSCQDNSLDSQIKQKLH
jgi:hypothetical protein